MTDHYYTQYFPPVALSLIPFLLQLMFISSNFPPVLRFSQEHEDLNNSAGCLSYMRG